MILRDGFQISQNPYDWLGDGVYFFQDAPARAWEWAVRQHRDEAAVLRANIRLVDCMDLLDPDWISIISDTYDSFMENLSTSGLMRPTQSEVNHRLDREVINYTIGVLGERGFRVACVRAAFREGRPVYPDSAIYDRAHVQIAVRDVEACIQGVDRENAPGTAR